MNLLDLIDQIKTIPPMYYLLRDRIPFYFTLIFIFRDNIPSRIKKRLSDTIYFFSGVLWVLTLTFHLLGNGLKGIYGINWSAPAPLTWGLYFILTYRRLGNKLEPFTAIYLSFMSIVAGGWLYEIPIYLQSHSIVKTLGLNYHKVFFIDFQVLSVLILMVYLYLSEYDPPRHLLIWTIVYGLVTVWYPHLWRHYVYTVFRKDSFLFIWTVRLPTIIYLLYLQRGYTDESSIST